MKIDRLSASSYNTWEQCNFKYFIGQVAGISDESGASALIGTICHHVCEVLSKASMIKHRKDSKIWNVQYLLKICFDHYYKKEPVTAAQIKTPKLNTISKGLINLINGPCSPIRDNTISVEDYFKIDLDGKEFRLPDGKQLKITGFIDRVDKIDVDTIEIVDYKSGSRSSFLSDSKEKKNSEALRNDIQAQIYYLAAKQRFPWAKNIIVTMIYFTDGGEISVAFDESDIPLIRSNLAKRMHEIVNNQDPKLNKSWRCKFCGYFNNGICQNIEQEVKENGFEFVHEKYVQLRNLARK